MPARLHCERVGNTSARRQLILLHGILGSGGNWRSIARALTERRPEWAVALVDLRHHGKSEGGQPPHDLASCADDVRALVDELGGAAAIAGHSFGGKVALAARAQARADLLQTYVLDASPSAASHRADDRQDLVAQVLALFDQLPRNWERRDDFVQAIVAAGHARSLAQWLAMNLVPSDSGYALRIDIAAIREMMTDFYQRDLWSVLLDRELPGSVEVVIAQRSPIVTADDQRRLQTPPPHVRVHTIDAGHWLHIDAPNAVLDLFARLLD